MKLPKLFRAMFAEAKTTTARILVEGMNCPSCVAKIEKAIGELPGVTSVKVDLATGQVAVEHEPEKVTPDQIRQRIVAAGYAVKE